MGRLWGGREEGNIRRGDTGKREVHPLQRREPRVWREYQDLIERGQRAAACVAWHL